MCPNILISFSSPQDISAYLLCDHFLSSLLWLVFSVPSLCCIFLYLAFFSFFVSKWFNNFPYIKMLIVFVHPSISNSTWFLSMYVHLFVWAHTCRFVHACTWNSEVNIGCLHFCPPRFFLGRVFLF